MTPTWEGASCWEAPFFSGIRVPKVEYRAHGIYTHEALAILAFCRAANIRRIIESGVCNGRSTTIFKKAGLHVTSVDTDDVKCDADRFIKGKGQDIIPDIVNGEAVLIDGPKGEAAWKLAKRIVEQAAFVAVHDVLIACPKVAEYFWRSDDPVFQEHYGRLRDNDKYPLGPGLGVIWDDRLCRSYPKGSPHG